MTRNKFFSDKGKDILTNCHKLVGTIERRLVTGYYNNVRDVFSKSFRSASKHMVKSLANLNFGKGFYKDWLITDLQSVFFTSLSKGLNGIKW